MAEMRPMKNGRDFVTPIAKIEEICNDKFG